jgi:hypothetical protein
MILEICSCCGIHAFIGLGLLQTGIKGFKVVTDFKGAGNTVKKVWKSSILLSNIDQTVQRVQYMHHDIHTILLNDIEMEGSWNLMIVGVVWIYFDLQLVQQLMPTINQGMGLWGTWDRHQFIRWYSMSSSFQAMGETGLSNIIGCSNTFQIYFRVLVDHNAT